MGRGPGHLLPHVLRALRQGPGPRRLREPAGLQLQRHLRDRLQSDRPCLQIHPQRYSPNSGHEAKVNSVAFSKSGELLASGSEDYTIRIWDLSNQSCLSVLSGHKDGVLCVDWSPDDQCIISSSHDKCGLYLGSSGSGTWPQRFRSSGSRAVGTGSTRCRYLPMGKRSPFQTSMYLLDSVGPHLGPENQTVHRHAGRASGLREEPGLLP